MADFNQRKVLAIRPGDATFLEVLECPGGSRPTAILIHSRSLYVSMVGPDKGLYEYALPPGLQLE